MWIIDLMSQLCTADMNLNTLNTDIRNNIRDYIIFKPKNKDELKKAVDLWCENKDEALNYYGHISLWNTSLITDMSFLFYRKPKFNENISKWNVSNVTVINSMFNGAYSFNQPLDSWDVSSVTDMWCMFHRAKSFNQPLNKWDVSSVTYMKSMFSEAKSFNQPINSWDVSSVTNMEGMFKDAESFNQPLDNWNKSPETNVNRMFLGAVSFNQPLNNWIVSSETQITRMFWGAVLFNKNNLPSYVFPEKQYIKFSSSNRFLVCPVSGAPLVYDRVNNRLICYTSKLVYPIIDGLPILFEDKAKPFIE